jgi:hypothetical protein
MKCLLSAIHGGAKVSAHKDRPLKRMFPALVVALALLSTSAAFAQGSIYGTVNNSDATVPANGEISFFGYLDDTDEEIRLESSIGAGYDAGNWYDDFQNYLTEAPGNPYDHHFYNSTNGEGYILSKLIPDNSYQEENIVLASIAWPAAPAGLAGQAISASSVVISWNGVAGHTYHVYRRMATSDGSFFRIDDPSGSLANPGVADSFFIDTGVDGVSEYDYVVIAEDGSTNLSPHSGIITVSSATVEAPVVNAIIPNSGFTIGGTSVTITGSGFDTAGATATIGGAALTSQVIISPFEITGETPPGTEGAVDVVFTNTASGLSSTLVGGFTYVANEAPVVSDIPDQTIDEGSIFATINLDDYVSDVDNTDAEMTWTYSGNVELSVDVDVNRVATIIIPGVDWNGSETITFRATDPGTLYDEDPAIFTVNAVNDAPVVSDIPDQTVPEGGTFTTITLDDYVSDVDNTDPEMTWTYSGNVELTVDIDINRIATITIPGIDWNGSETIHFKATDPGLLTDSNAAIFTVTATNDPPVLDPIGPRAVNENENLNFTVTASDPDGTFPALSAENSPLGATFDDQGDGTGIFDFTPDFTQSGVYNVTFIASDGALADTEIVAITVNNVNQPPVLEPIGPRLVNEGANLNFVVTASDADGTIPALTTSTPPLNASFADNGDGTGTFDFDPDYTQAGLYPVTFYADDGVDIDSEVVEITVNEEGNQAPILDPIGDQIVYENTNLNLTITASDPDGTIPSLSATDLENATFTDHGDGTGTFDFNPTFDQEGDYPVTFKAFDGALVDSEVVTITVLNTNREPVLDSIGPQSGTEGVLLSFLVTASDPDGTIPQLTTSTLPSNAFFTDSLNGVGLFEFTPDFAQAGVHNVTFYAGDGTDTDSELVVITIAEAGNQAPILDSIGPKFVIEGELLNFIVTASDPDGTIPDLTALNLPTGADFIDNLDGTGTFDFTPDFTQAGVYGVTFIADDGVLADSELVLVTVSELGNLAPVMDSIPPQMIYEGDTLTINISATDPDGDSIVFSYTSNQPMTGISLADNFDGTAVLTYMPDYFSAGIDTLRIFATDNGIPPLSDAEVVEVTTFEINQPPTIDSIGPFGTKVGRTLEFTVTAHDSTDQTGGRLYLTASGLPDNSEFVDQGDNTGLFSFTPVLSQVGILTVRFIVVDEGTPQMSDWIDVEIEVVASNQPPILEYIGPKMVLEGDTLIFTVTASDPEGTIPSLFASDVPDSASFVDNLDGTGTFTFMPTYVMSGLYGVVFEATDGIDIDRETVLIQVLEAGNQPPNLFFIPDQEVLETETLTFTISGDDPDGTLPTFETDTIPDNAELVNNDNGTATFTFTPYFTQQGDYDIYFIATDGELADSQLVRITVTDIGNQMPALDPINNVHVIETDPINFDIHVVDVDSVVPILTTSTLPGTATFVDNLDYTGTFDWATGYEDEGTDTVTFYATDGTDPLLVDSITIEIVVENNNRMPWIVPNPFSGQSTEVNEGDTLVFRVEGGDDDGILPLLSMNEEYPNFTFTDSLDGFGYMVVTPDYTQTGTFDVHFVAHDGDSRYPNDSTATQKWLFTVYDVEAMPVLDPIGPRSVTEGDTLEFEVNATDPGGGTPTIDVYDAPANSVLLGTGVPRTFRFTPDYLQAGEYIVLFVATNITKSDSEYVTVTVVEAGNQPPYFDPPPPENETVILGDPIYQHIIAVDPEKDSIILSLIGAPAGVVFVDSGNGAGDMVWLPEESHVGFTFNFQYIATDTAGAADTVISHISVVSLMRGDANNDQLVNIGDVTFLVAYIFKDGESPVVQEAGDANFDGGINLSDAIYLVNYIFKNGPPPYQGK